MLFKRLKDKKIQDIIDKVNKKHLVQRYTLLILGCLIVALAFNIFFVPFSIVCFGVSGLSIVLAEFGIEPSIFILISNLVLLVVSYFTLGKEDTKNSLVGSLIFPLFVGLTEIIIPYVNFSGLELIVIAVFGAVLTGFGYGLIFKTGFTTGGTDIINQLLAKYAKVSMGKAILLVDGVIVLIAKIVFPWEIVLYGIIVLYIISVLTDKVILGISESKAFYVITKKEAEAKEFLLSIMNGGVTLINSKGGYSDNKHELLLAVVPTRMYYVVKEGLKDIDEDVFFLVCDAYEVSNKVKKYE